MDLSLEVHDAPDGTDLRVHASPVVVPPVLAGAHVVVAAPVVGLLVHQPVAVHHVAGVEVGHAEAVHEVGAVVAQLIHLAGHVGALVQPHPEVTAVLQGGGQGEERGTTGGRQGGQAFRQAERKPVPELLVSFVYAFY